MTHSTTVLSRVLTTACLLTLIPATQAETNHYYLLGIPSFGLIGPDTYHAVSLTQPELVSLWSDTATTDDSAPSLTLPKNTFATPTALERVGGGVVDYNLAFQVTKYSNFGTPVTFTLTFRDFAELGFENAVLPDLAGPLVMRMKPSSAKTPTRIDFKVTEMIVTPTPAAEYIELSCSKSENGGRSSELILGKDDIAYRRNYGALGIKNGRVAKADGTEFIIHSFHLGLKERAPEYVKRLRYSDVGLIGDRTANSYTNLITDVKTDLDKYSLTGRTSLQAFRGPCVITIQAVDGGPEWAFQQFYVHRGNGSRFLTGGDKSGLRILSQPSDVTAESGDPVTLSVAASGAGNLSYQWLFDGKAIPGATNSAYIIKSVRSGDEGSYAVVVRSAKESVTSDAAFVDILGSKPKPGPRPPR